MSGRCSRCGVSFPHSCGVWPLPLFWLSVCGRFLSRCMAVSSCWGMAVFSHFGMSAFRFVCICNPLHAARRAMAAAPPLPKKRPWPFLSISISHPRPEVPSHWGSLSSFPPVRQTKEKERTHTTKEKYSPFGPPGLLLPQRGPKLLLTSIPFLHRRGLGSRVFTRGLGTPLSLWALRPPIALFLFCRPRTAE